MLMNRHLFLSHSLLLDHGIPSHPENASRLDAIFESFALSSYKDCLDLSQQRLASLDELTQVHSQSYIQKVLSHNGHNFSLDPETLITPGTVKAAFLAAGLGITLVEQVVLGNVVNGFALLRPPGHHARPSAGMGFCIFNNIAIAAKKALSKGLSRILILDWDVHHGNGTQETFYEDDKVLFIDIHQDNLFPINSGLVSEKGSGKGIGYTVNIPLPAGCRDEDYFQVFENQVKPLVLEYQPELILVSAGFDAHESDPMAAMNLTTEGFGMLAIKTKALAEQVCEGKLVLFLEGGYNPYFLARNVMECVKVLTEDADV